jgi:hypothetical protein
MSGGKFSWWRTAVGYVWKRQSTNRIITNHAPSGSTRSAGPAEQKIDLSIATSCQRRNSSPNRSQPQTSRGRDRLSVPTPGTRNSKFILMYTVSFPPAGPPVIHPLDSIPSPLLPSHRCTAACVSWQVRRRLELCLRTPSTTPGRRTRTARPSQVLRCVAASALPQRVDRLLQTTLRRSRLCAPVSRPLYPSRGHL